MLMKMKNIWQKIQYLKFRNSLKILVEILPRSMHAFLEVNLFCTFRGDVVWKILLLYGSMLMKMKKKNVNIQIFKYSI